MTEATTGDDRPPVRGATAGEVLAAAAVLLVLLAIFLWTPLTSSGTAYSSDDLLQSSPLVRTVPADYRFGNVMLTDPVLQMHPWLDWNREQILDGDMPVWNPYNGAGTPHLANFVSAVLSPFSAPFYVLPWRAALLVSAGLKLFVLGLFTYLFLRKVAVSHVGGLVGAAGFMFAAYNVLWVAWPHPGAAICLPMGLYFAEVAMQSASRVRQRWAWCGYALAVLGALLAGHPETLFFSWGVVLAYVPVRLLVSRDLGGGRERLAKAGQFVIASVLAMGLAAVQLLPFVEYLHRSTAYAEGAERAQAHFALAYSGLHAFPNLFGAPSETYYQPLQLVGGLELPNGTRLASNYIESNGFYVGLLVLLLAFVGLVALVRRRTFVGVFAAVAAVVWVVYAHDLGGIGHTVGTLPLVELSAINRSHPIWAFAVCCLAALGVDALLRAGGGGWRRAWLAAVGVAAGGTLLLAGAVLLARDTLDAGGNLGGRVLDPIGKAAVDAHLKFVAFSFLAGVAVLVALVGLASRGRWVRGVAGLAVVGVVFAQGGWLLRSHNPTIDADLEGGVASSPGLAAVARATGPTEETVSLGPLLSADANLWYRLRTPETYDGVGVRRYEQLQRDLAALPEPLRGRRTLDVLGIRYVASEQVYPTALPAARLPVPGRTFAAIINGLHSVTAVLGPLPPGGNCQVTLELVDTGTGAVAGQSAAPCRKPFTALSFPPIAASQGRTYSVIFGGQAEVLALAPWAQGLSGLEQVDGNDAVALFRAPGTPGRYFSPADARPVADDDEARRILASPDFAMAQTVLVDDDEAATAGTVGTVELLEQQATKVRLRVTRSDPGWLVAIQTSYPGWTATVDGKRADVERADYAFTAVEVGAGTHEVVLRYRPKSLRYGMIVTAEALVLMVIWLATARPRTPRARRARIPWDPTKAPPPPDPEPDPEPLGWPKS